MALPAPVHVNQLTAGTTFPNGRPSGPFDCAVACGRMNLDAWSRGGLRPSTTEFRAKQHDQDHNGIGLDDIAAAWRGFGVTFDQGSHSWSEVYARWLAGDGACIPGHYGDFGSWSAQPSFTGPHMIYVQRVAPGGLLVDDPLRSSAVVIPTAIIRRFFEGRAGWGRGTYTGAGATDAIPVGFELPDVGGAIGDAAADVVVNVAILGSILYLTFMGLKAILVSPLHVGQK